MSGRRWRLLPTGSTSTFAIEGATLEIDNRRGEGRGGSAARAAVEDAATTRRARARVRAARARAAPNARDQWDVMSVPELMRERAMFQHLGLSSAR